MRRLIKRRFKKVGLPPGSLVYVGETTADKTTVSLVRYDERGLSEKQVAASEIPEPVQGEEAMLWVDVAGLSNVEEIQEIGRRFNLHPLLLEDVLNTDQRPKFEDFDDTLYVVLKALSCDRDTGQVLPEQVSLVLGDGFVITFQERRTGLFKGVRERLRNGKGRIRGRGADYLAYALMDAAVDTYFAALESVEDRIEPLDSELMSHPQPETLRSIQELKTEAILLRKSLWPLREVTNRLARGESRLVSESTLAYFRDVYDHTIQATDTVESFRDILSGMLDIYLSSVSNTMNAVMKTLTLAATIFLPLTLLAGIYGMNFDYMPELHLRWAYPVFLVLLFSVAVGMIVYFKRRKWL